MALERLAVSLYFDEHQGILDLHGKCPQIDADGGTLCLAGAIVELAVVFRSFDQMSHHQTVTEMHVLMGAAACGGIELAIGCMIDGIG